MPEIVVEKVVKSFGGFLTLNGIDLKVENGSFVGILGPSGCGKSTFLHIMAGLLQPDEGRVYVDGEDFTGKPGRASYMQQKDLLLPSRTVLDNVIVPLVLKGMPKKKARRLAFGYLEQFGLKGFENHYPRQLSGGMRQRAAMLRTYLFSSDILLLDEPFASLDAITKSQLHRWLIEIYNSLRPTVVLVTHDIEEALYLCDKIYVFSNCPTLVKCAVDVPFCRPEGERTIKDPRYPELKEFILTSLA